MKYYGNLKIKLKKLAFTRIIVSLFFIAFLLISVLLISNKIISYSTISKSNQEITDIFSTLYDNNDALAESKEFTDFILENNDITKLNIENRLRRFNSRNIAKSNVLLYDSNFNLLYSSYVDQHETQARKNYSIAILNNLHSRSVLDTYNSVYKIRNDFPDLMINREIFEGNVSIGYISIFISGHDFSYYLLSNYNNDSVVTDLSGNIIFYTRSLLLENTYKFNTVGTSIKLNQSRYNISTYTDLDRKMIISTFAKVENYSLIIYLFISITLVAYLWYRNSISLTSLIIDKNIESVNLLLEEINSINDDSYNQRISINTKDEYEIIEQHINQMLDRLSDLNTKNIELLQLNSVIEMKQLLLQYHPHFLYNTLEIIKASINFQPEVADEIILQLTRILKYSIENPLKDICFEHDLEYIEDYLKIQKARFSDKFNYTLDIEDSALQCTIPKLLLQPVIENSIKHGFKDKEVVNICIKAKQIEEILILQVSDDGTGMSDHDIILLNKKLQSIQTSPEDSIGLYNIARRLQLSYSDYSGIVVSNNNPGLKVTIMIDQSKIKED